MNSPTGDGTAGDTDEIVHDGEGIGEAPGVSGGGADVAAALWVNCDTYPDVPREERLKRPSGEAFLPW